jgi:hypothetical protein
MDVVDADVGSQSVGTPGMVKMPPPGPLSGRKLL